MIQTSTSLKYEPALELLLITAKQLFSNRDILNQIVLARHVRLDVGGGGRVLAVRGRYPRQALRTSIKSQFWEVLTTFGDKGP